MILNQEFFHLLHLLHLFGKKGNQHRIETENRVPKNLSIFQTLILVLISKMFQNG
jgi:hypothetical protein